MWHVWGKFFVDGNVNTKYNEVTNDKWTYGIYNQIDNNKVDGTYNDQVKQEMHLDSPIPFVITTTHTAEKAYEKVLLYAGASLHRDALDELIVSDTRSGVASVTGSNNASGYINSQDDLLNFITGADSPWPTLTNTEVQTDTDGDGMPDTWEDANGLDKNNPDDHNLITEAGYTQLENYLNALVDEITQSQNEEGTVMGETEVVSSISEVRAGESFGHQLQHDDVWYSLQGIRMSTPHSGVLIKDGKKVLVR